MVTMPRYLAFALMFIATAVVVQAETIMTLRGDIANSATQSYEDAVKRCTQPMLAQCLQREVRDATESLVVTYKSVEESLRSNPKELPGLRASQRAWSEFLKTNCEFLGSVTKSSSEYQACMLHSIYTRSSELHTYIGWD